MDMLNNSGKHRYFSTDFFMLAIANLFITTSVYVFAFSLPVWLQEGGKIEHLSVIDIRNYTSIIMGSYGIGLFLMGFSCNWLIQKYRRNAVCLWAVLGVALSFVCLWVLEEYLLHSKMFYPLMIGGRVMLGLFFGLVQMVLGSTLIIDKVNSLQRTEANTTASWFGRMSIALGPIVSIISVIYGFNVVIVALLLALMSFILIRLVRFPFRIPEDGVKIFSTDRFVLPTAKWLFINLFLLTSVIGMLISVEGTLLFYSMLFLGLFLAYVTEKKMFANADLASEIIMGIILMSMALIMMLASHNNMVKYVAPLFIGLGIGWIGSKFLLFFIKLSKHCQRGTSLSTYMLSWESGIAFGLFVGYRYSNIDDKSWLYIPLCLCCTALIFYRVFVHSWYVKHKNR